MVGNSPVKSQTVQRTIIFNNYSGCHYTHFSRDTYKWLTYISALVFKTSELTTRNKCFTSAGVSKPHPQIPEPSEPESRSNLIYSRWISSEWLVDECQFIPVRAHVERPYPDSNITAWTVFDTLLKYVKTAWICFWSSTVVINRNRLYRVWKWGKE